MCPPGPDSGLQADARPVPVHAERTDDPATLRWYLGRSLTPSAAVVRPLQRLVDEGVLAEYDVGPISVTTRLGTGRSWPQDAAAVRAAVQDVVRQHLRQLENAAPEHRDALIAQVGQEILASVVSPVANTHGGAIDIVAVVDGTVTVRTRGACHGCAASAATVHLLFERELRQRLPEFSVIVEVQ